MDPTESDSTSDEEIVPSYPNRLERAKALKLRPCPFCGSPGRLVNQHGSWAAECSGCLTAMAYCQLPEQAAEAWNRRVR